MKAARTGMFEISFCGTFINRTTCQKRSRQAVWVGRDSWLLKKNRVFLKELHRGTYWNFWNRFRSPFHDIKKIVYVYYNVCSFYTPSGRIPPKTPLGPKQRTYHKGVLTVQSFVIRVLLGELFWYFIQVLLDFSRNFFRNFYGNPIHFLQAFLQLSPQPFHQEILVGQSPEYPPSIHP